MTMSPSLPYCRCKRRALALTSSGFNAGVSSMCIGASCSLPTAVVSRCQSSSVSRPVRSLCWSSLPTDPRRRIASCAPDISMLNMATGNPLSTATCSPMFSARAVLPILGRPARMIRSPGCIPAVLRSRSSSRAMAEIVPPELRRWCIASHCCWPIKLSCVSGLNAPTVAAAPQRALGPFAATSSLR